MRSVRPVVHAVVAAALLWWCWLFRFNDPEGGFGGLTDDHYFYLVRGWQLLFGDLPDRDFVDPGAPLHFVLAWLAQVTLGRGTWSEVVFCVTALSMASVLTYLLATRASGSITIGLLAALFQIALSPRLYNYPKVLVYALAIPALWAYIDRPTTGRRAAVAAVTAFALLMRHDHGVFVGLAMLVAILARPGAELKGRLYLHTLTARAREAVLYGALTLVCLAPYLAYLQVNGGIVEHVRAANSWAQRDRDRAPLILPEFAWQPTEDENPPRPEDGWWRQGIFVPLWRNHEPWTFWLLWALPLATAASLLAHPHSTLRPMRDTARRMAMRNGDATGTRVRPEPDRAAAGFTSGWPDEHAKMWVVVALAIVLNVGFLRGNLSVRFGDVSVPHALLVAWLMRVWLVWVRGRWPLPVRVAGAAVPLAVAVVTALMLTTPTRHRLEAANMGTWPWQPLRRAEYIASRLKQVWPLENWFSATAEGPIRLAFYLRECTEPDDRVFIARYAHYVYALAQRAFAGGHPDLRLSFFVTSADQRLTISRLEKHPVPIVLVPDADEYDRFREEFPRLDAYFALHYTNAGDVDLGDGDGMGVLIDKRRTPTRVYEPLGAPCFR